MKIVANIVTTVVAVVSLNAGPATPANAQLDNVANGRRCDSLSVTDPTVGSDVQSGYLEGGPLVASAPGASVSMTCTIQVGAANVTHSGTDSCSVSSNTTLQVAAIPPTLCSYLAPHGQPVYMCTQVTINGVPYYRDDSPFGNGGWVTNSSALCNEGITQDVLGPVRVLTEILIPILDDPLDPVRDLFESLYRDVIDPILCPIFGLLAPGVPGVVEINSQGDIFVLGLHAWICPPYDS